MRVISYGGGVQSTALLVLAAQERLPYRTFLFANVGDDSEHPATLTYLREVATPFAMRHGLELMQLARRRRDGSSETLMQQLKRPDSRSVPIPVRMANGAPGRRSCTAEFKIKVIGRWLREQGATAQAPATVGIGISVDEIYRANRRRAEPYERIAYPLLDLGLRRADCERLIADAGLPIPPKSACFFCPFKTVAGWRQLRRDEPDLFSQAAALEDTINQRREVLGRDPVYLTRYGRPLATAIPMAAETDPADEPDGTCDSGWCMT